MAIVFTRWHISNIGLFVFKEAKVLKKREFIGLGIGLIGVLLLIL